MPGTTYVAQTNSEPPRPNTNSYTRSSHNFNIALRFPVTTTPYPSIDGTGSAKFRSVLLLNTTQSFLSSLSALTFLYLTKHSPGQSIAQLVGLPSSSPHSPGANKKAGLALESPSAGRPSAATRLLRSYFLISVVSSLASPFGFLALSHISFPTLLLGKSCKLVPVMLMNVVLYRRKFPLYKYLLVGLVTLGIWAFMAFKESKGAAKGPATSSALGLGLLGVNLLLDGVVNSSQDEVFSRFKIDGPQMMFFMNAFSTLITSACLLFPTALTPSFLLPVASGTSFNALSSALSFIGSHPAVTFDLLLFSLCGAVGQLFIFVTLSHYGSLTLVTITVTRKMVTMLLSVFVFDHRLTNGQWAGVGLTFGAIAAEAEIKRRETVKKRKLKQG